MKTLFLIKSRTAILIADKVYIRIGEITSSKGGYCIIIKGPTHQVDTVTLNVYVQNKKASKYMKQKLRKPVKKNRQIYNCNLGCSILLTVNNKTTKQKRIKDIEEVSINTIN